MTLPLRMADEAKMTAGAFLPRFATTLLTTVVLAAVTHGAWAGEVARKTSTDAETGRTCTDLWRRTMTQ